MYNPGDISRVDDLSLPPWERGVRQKGVMSKDIVMKNAIEMKKVLQNNGVRFVVFFGSLLGSKRNGEVIPGDSDFDIMCFAEDYLKWENTKKELRAVGFTVPENKPLMDDYLIRNGEKIDINWMIKFGKYYVYDNGIYYPISHFSPLETTKIGGEDFPCPNNSEKLLVDLYGSDWKIPQSKKGRLEIYPK